MEKIDSKLFIYIKYKMEIIIPKELYESLTLIIKYQNTLLLKEIAKDKNWKYNDLKKEFLKDSDMEILIKKYKKKQKLNTKKIDENIEVSVESIETVSVESVPPVSVESVPPVSVESVPPVSVVSVATVSVEPDLKTKKKKKKIIKINKSLLVEPITEIVNTESAKTEIVKTESAETVIAKTESSVKKKLKKIINNKEIKCHKYIFEGVVFYVNIENNNAYDKNMEFVGRMLGNGINFNEDEKEN